MSAHDAAAAYDHRYTDRDVREDPRLVDLAIAYLQTYGGDFEPLVEAQVHLRDHGTALPTALVRKVLNCMRHDLAVAGALPAPQRPVLRVVVPTAAPARRAPAAAPEPPRRRPFALRVVWKAAFLESTAVHATVFHEVDPRKSSIWYDPETQRTRTWASPYCQGPSTPRARLSASPSSDRVPCKTCARVKRDRAERAERSR